MDLGIIIGVVIGLVVLVIGLTIVCDIILGANFGGGSGTLYTVMTNIPLLLGIGGLVYWKANIYFLDRIAVGWAVLR